MENLSNKGSEEWKQIVHRLLTDLEEKQKMMNIMYDSHALMKEENQRLKQEMQNKKLTLEFLERSMEEAIQDWCSEMKSDYADHFKN